MIFDYSSSEDGRLLYTNTNTIKESKTYSYFVELLPWLAAAPELLYRVSDGGKSRKNVVQTQPDQTSTSEI